MLGNGCQRQGIAQTRPLGGRPVTQHVLQQVLRFCVGAVPHVPALTARQGCSQGLVLACNPAHTLHVMPGCGTGVQHMLNACFATCWHFLLVPAHLLHP